MKVAFHLATPPAPVPELDAAVQEVGRLRSAFDGSLSHLYPSSVYRWWIPRRWLPSRVRENLFQADRHADLHHIVTDRLLAWPELRRLRRPVVCTLLAPPSRVPRVVGPLERLDRIIVSSPGDVERLRAAGLPQGRVMAPAIDVERFKAAASPPTGPFTILVASAPWTRRQFATKGFDALLSALRTRPGMRLILLWRGVLEAQIESRIRRSGIASRIELLRGRVDVAQVLDRVHLGLLAPTTPRVVRSYPHSLLEALAAGRPILTSPNLAISDLVRENHCGLVVEPCAEALGIGLDEISGDYERYRSAACGIDLDRFAPATFIRAWRTLYEELLSRQTT